MSVTQYSIAVEVLDEPYEVPGQKIYEQTACVVIRDWNNKIIQSSYYGVVDRHTIYDRIEDGQPIEISNCYIRDFSLTEYRKLRKLDANSVVDLPNLVAINTFFHSQHDIDFSNARFHGDVSTNFINAVFRSANLSFFKAVFETGDLDFTQAKFFTGIVDFQYVEFSDGHTDFKNSLFMGDNISFINSNFRNGYVSFAEADFGNVSAAFQYAKFGTGDISFEKAIFRGGKVDFSKVEFGDGKVDFRLCQFGDGDILFNESEFGKGRIRFRRATFGNGHITFELTDFGDNDVGFERTEFGHGKLSFYKAKGRNLHFSESYFNNYLDLRVQSFDKIDMADTTIRDIVDLKSEDEVVHIRQLNFAGLHNLGRIFLDWEDNDVARLIHQQSDTTKKQKAEQFRMLKEEFHQAGQYNDEDRAYLEFKRLELKIETAYWLKKSKSNAFWVYPTAWFKRLVFDQIGHYATNPIRVLGSMVVAFTLFSLVFVLVEYFHLGAITSSIGDPDNLGVVSKAFYHSAITFLTIGYGDYYPSGLIRPLSGLEGFLGLFLMSYFTVAFVRKVLR